MRVAYSKSCVKTVKKQSGKTLDSIKTTIQEVKNASKIDDITDCKKLTGYSSVYRIRVGTWRAFFVYHIEIIDDVVFFHYLVPRGQAYSKSVLDFLKKID